MTLFQETASAQKPLTSDSAIWPFQAMLAGLVVLLMAVAAASFVVVGGPADISTGSNLGAAYANGYPLHGGLAGPSRVTTNAADSFAPGYPLHGGLAGPSRVTTNAADSFAPGYPLHGGLAGPGRVDEGDALIRRILLADDQAAAAGSSLRFAPQAADGATDGDNQRFVQVD